MTKPNRYAIAAAIHDPNGALLIIKRPDTDSELGGLWGLPALTRLAVDDEREIAEAIGPKKLGVKLAVGDRIGEQTMDRGSYVLHLADYEATIVEGDPVVPQDDPTLVQYTDVRFVSDPSILCISALKGSVCSRIYLDSIGINWREI